MVDSMRTVVGSAQASNITGPSAPIESEGEGLARRNTKCHSAFFVRRSNSPEDTTGIILFSAVRGGPGFQDNSAGIQRARVAPIGDNR